MTRYKKEEIERFLHKKYKKNIKLEPVAVGMDSQVYAYEFQKQKYIIRINEKLEGFKKDEYAYNNFRSDIIKIPRIIEYGNFNNDYYCISERINGITFQDDSSSLINNLLAKVVNVLNSINSVDISKTTGYGVFDSTTGNANYNTWKEFLLDIFSSDYNFNLIKEKKYVDNDLLEKLFKKYKDLIKYTNETRKLYHGDFGSNNLLVEADNILGVIDWDMASYGDPLYEIANTYFWSTWLLCMKRSYAYFEKEYGNIKNYQELIKCYCIRIALIEIYENALIGNEEMTIWLQDRISKICL